VSWDCSATSERALKHSSSVCLPVCYSYTAHEAEARRGICEAKSRSHGGAELAREDQEASTAQCSERKQKPNDSTDRRQAGVRLG
jgi:hypothetical protein